MPLVKASKVLGQKREGKKLALYYKTPAGKVKKEFRTGCKCSKNRKKPCSCK